MNKRQLPSFAVAAILLSTALPSVHGDEKPAETEEVKLRGLVLQVPKTWERQDPLSRLRLAQFALPAVEGDKEPAELAVFSFGAGGAVKDNIKRWMDQFHPEGRTAKVTVGNSPQGQYVLLEVAGTYKKPDGPPVEQKTIDAPGYRVLAVILAVPEKGNFFLKAAGPDKTATAHAKALRASFGAKAENEKELSLDE